MTLPVKLSDVAEQLSIVSEDTSVYLNKRNGEFVVLSENEIFDFEDDELDENEDLDIQAASDVDEPEWIKEEQRLRREVLNSDDYLQLPDKFDIHDWQIMDDFCRSVKSADLRDELLGLIRGRGAFGRFNAAVRSFGIDNDWYEFRDRAYEQIALEWLEENEIEFFADSQFPIAKSAAANVVNDANRWHRDSTTAKASPRGTNEKKSLAYQPETSNSATRKSNATDAKSEEIKVFIAHRDSKCDECGEQLGQAWITLEENKGALCLACADLDELIFLPTGDAALTRRSKKYSTLSAVVLKFSRARRRYERQGLLVEEAALERAEAECLADSEVRERRNERARERRAGIDEQYVRDFAKRIRMLFPNCPKGREQTIAEHACLKYSERIGRSAAAKSFEAEAIRLAVAAHVRHRETNYDSLLAKGWFRNEARSHVRERVEAVMETWEGS